MDRRFTCRRAVALTLALGLLVLLTMGCGGSPAPTQGTNPTSAAGATKAPAATQPAVAQATVAPTKATAQATVTPTKAAAQATAAPTKAAAAATATAKPSGLAGALGQFASPNTLDSYRSKTSMGELNADGTKGLGSDWTMEWVKEGPSFHMVMGSGASALETIVIGDRTWIKMMGSWIESPAGTGGGAGSAQDTGSYLPQEDVTVKAMGSDTVGGIPCKKYSYTGKVTVDMGAAVQGGVKSTWEIQGEMCIADKAGLPPVPVRQTGQMKGALAAGAAGSSQESLYFETELYDINVPITIKPPEGATTMPSIPTIAAGIGTVVPRTATPASGQAPKPTAAAAATPTASADLAACFDEVPDYGGDSPDAITMRLAVTLAGAGPNDFRAYVTTDDHADVQAWFQDELPAYGWEQTGSGAGAPAGWDTLWAMDRYALRMVVTRPALAGGNVQVIAICSRAR